MSDVHDQALEAVDRYRHAQQELDYLAQAIAEDAVAGRLPTGDRVRRWCDLRAVIDATARPA